MPERQSSPGEAAAPGEPDITQNGRRRQGAGAPADPNAAAGENEQAGPSTNRPGTEQANGPAAVDPAGGAAGDQHSREQAGRDDVRADGGRDQARGDQVPDRPGNGSAAATGDPAAAPHPGGAERAAGQGPASPGPRPAGTGAAAAGGVANGSAVQGGAVQGGTATSGGPQGGVAASAAAASAPAPIGGPRPGPGQGGTGPAPVEEPTTQVRSAPPARPTPRPTPGPRPAPAPGAASDRDGAETESPTVRTPAGSDGPTVRSATASRAEQRPGGEAATVAVRAGQAESATPWFAPDAEATQVLPRTPAPARAAEPATERIPIAAVAARRPGPAQDDGFDGPDHGGPPGADEPPTGGRRPGRRRLLVLAAVVGALLLVYVGDLLLSSGSVPRGVTVAGVPVGGMALGEAEERLRSEVGARTSAPIPVTVGDARGEIDPATAGLAVDWPATLQRAGAQPLNPLTRVTSFFTEREVDVVSATDQAALSAAFEELAPAVDRAPTEGSVRFEGVQPVAVDPVPGQQLDVPAAVQVMERDWVFGREVALPLTVLAPTTTTEDVATAIEEVARPGVSAPVTVIGENGVQGTITPEVIATALVFRAADGDLVPEVNVAAVETALDPQLASSEKPGRDATIDFSSGRPVVVPSQDGRGIDYAATLAELPEVLARSDQREITAVYGDQPAELTTEELNALGITGLISEFTTGNFNPDSGQNIKRAAEQINGIVVEPGETFSLNKATGPRNASTGYVEAGIINDGSPSRGIAGGVSQVATTVYNAAYFAGMVDVEHKEHSFYISRYPPGREATVFEGSIDLKWRNDNPTGVLIQTNWTPTTITVRLYGTKRYEVTSTPGPRTNPTEPNTITKPAGEACSPSRGAPGFTITDTRTLREISTGQVRTERRTVKYNPSPIVVCEG